MNRLKKLWYKLRLLYLVFKIDRRSDYDSIYAILVFKLKELIKLEKELGMEENKSAKLFIKLVEKSKEYVNKPYEDYTAKYKTTHWVSPINDRWGTYHTAPSIPLTPVKLLKSREEKRTALLRTMERQRLIDKRIDNLLVKYHRTWWV